MKEIVLDNLYSATQADLSNVPSDEGTYQPQFFSIHGRLGRLRYIAYTWLSVFVLSFVSGIIAAILVPTMAKSGSIQSPSTSITLMILIYLPIIAASLIYTKRRLNDLDQSGWFGILHF